MSERLTDIFQRLSTVHEEGRLTAWSMALSNYYAAVQGKTQKSVDTLYQALTTLLGIREAKKMTATIADAWKAEGRDMAEGKAEGQAHSVILFLESRFNEVPAGIQEKLMAMRDGGRIETLVKLAATCQSLKEFQKAL